MPAPRLYLAPEAAALAWAAGAVIDLPEAAVRHVQVLRLQPGESLVLFDGRGGQWQARLERMGRREAQALLVAHEPRDCELPQPVTLAVGMPANERMDTLVEKAAELGAATLVPLLCERSVLRLSGERAERRVAHWQAVAVAASEQCGRTRVMQVQPVATLPAWLAGGLARNAQARLLSPRAACTWAAEPLDPGRPLVVLSGPEGGLTETEEMAASVAGFTKNSLGPRILRADTAPLAVLASLALGPNAG